MKTILLLLFFILSHCIYSQWAVLNTGTSQNFNTIYFVNPQTGFAAGVNGTIIKTTSGGVNWAPLISGSSAELRSIHFINSSTGLVCGYSGTILRTTNEGLNWTSVTSGTTNHLFGISFYNESVGIVAGNSGTTLYSTNGGLNWLVGNPTGYLVTFYCAYMQNASTGFCAGVNTIFSPLLAKTTNGGPNWVYSSFMLNNNEGQLRDIYFDSLKGIAVSNLWNGQGGISRSTNAGANWTTQLFTYALFGVDFPVTSTGYSVGYNGTIMKSTDNGLSWISQASGTTANLTAVDFVNTDLGYAAGYNGVILKTTNGGMVGIEPVSSKIPTKFYLYQNYPNPFNPSTKIKLDIPPYQGGWGDGLVKLIVYDILGKEITTLVNEELNPGTYEVEWDASVYPSGIYFYTLYVDGLCQSKKLILLK